MENDSTTLSPTPSKDRNDLGSKIFLLGLLAILVLLCFKIAQPFLNSIVAALVLAVVLAPLARWLSRILKSDLFGALIATLVGLFLAAGILGGVGLAVSREVSSLYRILKARSDQGGGWGPFFTQIVEPPLAWLSSSIPLSKIPLSKERVQGEILGWMGDLSEWMLKNSSLALGSVTRTAFSLGLAILILFFFLKDGRAILRHLGAILPLSLKQSDRLVLCVSQTLEANVHGVFAVALVQGILLFIGFLLFGLGSPLLWAFVGAFFSMIPVAGTGVVWVPAALSLCLSDRVPQGIGLAIWGFVVVGYADNIIRPLVVGSRARQHPLLVFFAMIGGILAFGLVGLLLGPIILASTFATIDLLREEFGMRSMTGSFLENQPVNRAMQVKTLEKSRTPRRTKLSPRRNAERHKSRLAE